MRLATRRSPLALAQANYVASLLAARGRTCVLVEITTDGDRRRDIELSEMGGQGVFAVEVQMAVLNGEADVAVHSAKDLPSVTHDDLVLASVPERRDSADVIVGRALAGLGPGATVATGSPRRRALLLERRPDLNIIPLRGNMASRLEAARDGRADAVVAAAAALERLGWSDRIAERLNPQDFIPQVGQGALALECRADDEATFAVLRAINNEDHERCLHAERAFLRELGAGCSIPAGANATLRNGELTLRAVMASFDGSTVLRAGSHGTDPDELGRALAVSMRDEHGGSGLEGWSR